ncbi:MAG: FG-GAP repeat domain-containing protein, partial [Nitrospinota bacterium]
MGRFARSFCPAIILPLLLLLPSSPLYAQEPAYRQALRNMSEKIRERFPHIEGFVASVQRGELYLSIGERDRVKKGLKLLVVRPGKAFKHPITGEVLGRLEEKIGEAEVIEVREKFSIARMVRLVPGRGYSPRKGDRVRFSSARVRIAVLPFHNRTDEVINTDLLTRTLIEYLKATGRFELFDLDRLQVWFLETGIPLDKILEGENARRLQRLIIRDLVLQPSIRALRDHMVLEARLFSLGTGNILVEARAVLAELPTAVAATPAPVPLAREGRAGAPTQKAPSLDSQFILSREGGPLSKGSVQQFILDKIEVQGVAMGDVDGDGKNELVVAGTNLIKVFRLAEGRLDTLYTYKAGGFDKCLWIDVADINGNGREEIYVTSVRDTALLSYVLEFERGEFRRLTSNQNYYFRTFKAQDGNPILVGQR